MSTSCCRRAWRWLLLSWTLCHDCLDEGLAIGSTREVVDFVLGTSGIAIALRKDDGKVEEIDRLASLSINRYLRCDLDGQKRARAF